MSTKDFHKMFPDLSVSIIASVQKHSADEAAVIASLQQLQSAEPSDEVKERMLNQLQDYHALGRQTVLDVLKENLWEVDDAVVPLFNLLIAKEKATVETKANDILENLFQGMDKDEIQAAIQKHDGDLNAAADEVVMKHLLASESPEQQKQREQNDLIKALKLRFATTPEDQIIEALQKAHWFPEQAVQILLRNKRTARVQKFQQEFPTLTASEIRGALERDDATTRVMLQVRTDEKAKAKPVKAVKIVKNEEREINREVRDITQAVEGHVAAKHPTALAKQALTHTMRLEGAGLINHDAPEAGNQQHKDGEINGLGLAVNTVPLRVPKVVEKGGKVVVAFDHVPTSANDWIGMYFDGQPETAYKSYQWVPVDAKQVEFVAPSICCQVFFRYFQNKTYRASGTSVSVHVGPEFLLAPEAVSPHEIKCSVQSLTEGNYPNLWVGIFNLNDKKNALKWEWAKLEAPVTFQIPKAGSYLLRAYPEKGYDFAAEKAVTTEGTNKLDVSFLENKQIQVNYSLTTVDPATDKVWIGIYKADEEDNRQYQRYKFVSTKSGSIVMKALPADGNYEARLFAHGTYSVLNKSAPVPFSL